MKKFLAITALVSIFAAAYFFVMSQQNVESSALPSNARSSDFGIESNRHLDDQSDFESKESVEKNREDDAPNELVRSIYDFDLAYSSKAVKAAEDLMQHHVREGYVRFEPIYVDPFSHLRGSYLEDGSMPTSISITPFQDISIVADQLDYQIMGHIQAAIWIGKIRGTENGQVEISIVGGETTPGFVIRFRNYPRLVSIYPTETDDVYIAVEGNPNQEYAEELM